MEDLQLVIFDMDGLLFDTEYRSFRAMKLAMEQRGFDFSLETYKLTVGIADLECDEILKEVYGQEFTIQHILNDYQEAFKEIKRKEGIILKPGAETLLDALEEKGIKKCIASSSSRETIHDYLSISGLSDRFDFYVSGEEVERGKPNPDIFLEACRRANETPAASIVLEDSLNGLRAAASANIKCIVVPDLIEPNPEMERFAYKIVGNLEEVAKILGAGAASC